MDGLNETFSGLGIQDRRLSVESCLKPQCSDMCPAEERRFRESQGLLHRLEMRDVTKFGAYQSRHRKGARPVPEDDCGGPFTDASRAVKSYQRPSAGQTMNEPGRIRTTAALCHTVDYLLGECLRRTLVHYGRDPVEAFAHYYDFVFDRLRAVRQDLTLQRACDLETLYILERCVQFYLYSQYIWLQLRPVGSTKGNPLLDVHLNRTHLQDSLYLLISYYDLFNDTMWSLNRPLYESVFLVHDLVRCPADQIALRRYQALRLDPLAAGLFSRMQPVTGLVRCFLLGRHIRCLRLIRRMATDRGHHLFCGICYLDLVPVCHRRLVHAIAVGFRAASARLPLAVVAEWLCPLAIDCHGVTTYLEQLFQHFAITIGDHGDGAQRQRCVMLSQKYQIGQTKAIPEQLRPVGWLSSAALVPAETFGQFLNRNDRILYRN